MSDFISVDFRLSVKCPQVIRERRRKKKKRRDRKGTAIWKSKPSLELFHEGIRGRTDNGNSSAYSIL